MNIRDEVVAFLERELIGPDPRDPYHDQKLSDFHDDEILRPQDPPRLRFGAGVLFPAKTGLAEAENAEESEVENEEPVGQEGEEPKEVLGASEGGDLDVPDEMEVNRANEFLPSAMGLTALVRLPRLLRVIITAGRYNRKKQEGLGKMTKKANEWQDHWFRRAIGPLLCDIQASDLLSTARFSRLYDVATEGPEAKLKLHVFCRPLAKNAQPLVYDATRDRMVTFTLLNTNQTGGVAPKDEECFFQCRFEVVGGDGEFCFCEYPERAAAESAEDQDGCEEESSLRLLYRRHRTFAVGHGCSANWSELASGMVEKVWTESLPRWEIKPIVPNDMPHIDLSFANLAANNGVDGAKAGGALAKEYLNWIEEQSVEVEDAAFPAEHREAARRHVKLCRECHRRIVDGVELLQKDPNIRQAFAWMNEAMRQQQFRYDLAANYRREWKEKSGQVVLEKSLAVSLGEQQCDPRTKRLGRWRPFQFAFVVMNLRAVARRESDERNIVDLIWFPTGGGKTEAYLGLTAFTIFWRRLDDPNDAGTTVLMRYTLRLLTTQQFQRAASLICACELIRRAHVAGLGSEAVSIGLWVGRAVTPNTNADALRNLNSLAQDGKENPFVVLTCPWCGAAMGEVRCGNGWRVRGYRQELGRVVFRCDDPACDFSERSGLPLHVVDEAIYEERPTLLIGTVDKFAMLPWNPKAQRLFGLDTNGELSPPDLVIQDELHLISGALGSMVGHYEMTLDELCRHGKDRFPAKIIASTATICRARDQIWKLYARRECLFPPQGLKTGESFFAREAVEEDGRLYLGVFASALSSHVTAQVRVMSALLQAVNSLAEDRAELLDPYWTLVSYFNSLRELGHAATLLRADIRDYMNAMWDRLDIRSPKEGGDTPDRRRFIDRDLELTSRVQSSQIPEALKRLFERTGDGVDERGRREQRAVDVCLATNMIQVGLDVPRLGLMTVVGQPKTTSEYIQASSRVGRTKTGPGLVVTVFNAAKPRDRSHFEHFRAYHQSIYRWVEPTSVTPFALPVRERALHAQLVTMVRYLDGQGLRETPNPVPPSTLFDDVRKRLLARVAAVDNGESALTNELYDEIKSRWQRLMPQTYGQPASPPSSPVPLMYPAGFQPPAEWGNRARKTPTSMRNVDAGCDAVVIEDYPNA
jgi:hypothetical protein